VPLNILRVLGKVPCLIKPYVCCELQQSEQGSVVIFFTSSEESLVQKIRHSLFEQELDENQTTAVRSTRPILLHGIILIPFMRQKMVS